MELFTYELSFDGDSIALDTPQTIEALLDSCVRISGLKVVNKCNFRFSPQGYTSTHLLSESHIAVHTWPEKQRGYLVLSTCKQQTGDMLKEIKEIIRQSVSAQNITTRQC